MKRLPKKGGGILNSAEKLQQANEEDLYEKSLEIK